MIAHLDDLESDFSRFHRVDDVWRMDGPRFMRMAWRIEAYGGVMALRRREQFPELAAMTTATAVSVPAREVVDLAQFMARVPGSVEVSRVEAG